MVGVADVTAEIAAAKDSGDYLTARKLQKKQLQDIYASLLVDEAAQDPSGNSPVWANPQMRAADHEVALSAFMMQNTRRNLQVQEVLNNSNWNEIAAFGNSIVERYKTQNKADVINQREGISPEEHAQQFQPVMVDPNEIANWRQQLVKLDNAMKQFGGSVFTHPSTSRLAKIINTEAGPGTPGYATSKEQDITQSMGGLEKALLPIRFGVEAAAEELIDLGVGAAATLEQLGSLTVDGMSGGQGAAYYNKPTGWVQDSDGQWYHNGGKVSAGLFLASIWHSLTGQALDQEVARYEQAKDQFVGQSAGVQRIANNVGMAIGQFAAFGAASAVPAKLAMKGIRLLVGAEKAGVSLSRVKNITTLLAGQGIGLGAYEAIKNGHIEGYGAAALHGSIMAAPMMLFGAMGRGAERFFRRTEKMPKRLAAAMGGAVEGIGWTSLDWDPVWRFVKDPSKQTLADMTEAVLVNSIAMAALKGMHEPTKILPSMRHLQGERITSPAEEAQKVKVERVQTARQAETPEDVASMATNEGVSTEAVENLGRAERERQANVGVDTERAQAANTEAKAASDKLEVEARQLDSTHMERLEQRLTMTEKVEVLRQMPEGPEKRRLTILHLQAMRGALGKSYADTITKATERAYDVDLQSMKNTKEMGEAQAVLNALLGPEGKTTSDYSTKVKREIGPEKMAEIEGLAGKQEQRLSQAKGVEGFAERLEKEHIESDAPGEFVKTESLSLEGLQELRAEKYAGELRQDAGEQRFFAETPPKPPMSGFGEHGLPPSRQPERVTDKTIRLSDIEREMNGFEGDEVRLDFRKGVGRGLPQGVLGWFDPLRNTSRYRDVTNNIITKAHEWSHAMDAVRGKVSERLFQDRDVQAAFGGSAKYYPGYVELTGKRQAAEGWATFWARYMLEDPRLRSETGPGYDKLLSWMAQPAQAPLLRQLKRIQSGLTTYQDMGALKRGEKRYHFEGDPKSEQQRKEEGPVTRRVMSTIKRALVDDLLPLREGRDKWLKAAYGKEGAAKILKELSIDFNPIRQLDIMRGTASTITERFMTANVTDLSGKVVGEGFKSIVESIPKGRDKDFWNYMGARRDLESLQKGRETHLSGEDAIIIAERLGTQEFRDIASPLHSFWRNIMEYMIEAGVYSRDQAERIFGSYEHYVPFEAVMDVVGGRGGARSGDPVKRMKGGTYEVKDPVQATTNIVQAMIAKAQQTIVLKAALKYEAAVKGQGGFITEVDKGMVPQHIAIESIVRALEQQKSGGKDEPKNITIEQATKALESLLAEGQIGDAILTFTTQTFPKGTKPIVPMRLNFTAEELSQLEAMGPRGKHWASRDGKVVWLEMEVESYEALLGLDIPKLWMDKAPPMARAFVETPARIVREGATGLSSGFVVAQVPIDSMFYSLRSPHISPWMEPLGIINGLGAYIQGAWKVFSGHPDAELYKNLGGYLNTLSGSELQAGRSASELMGGKRGVWQQLRRGIAKYGEFISKFESPIRVQSFSREMEIARKEGLSDREAGMRALEEAQLAAVRYTEAGAVTGAMRRLTPYLTAGIAAQNQLARVLSGKDKVSAGVAWRRMMWSVGVPSLLLYWLNKDDKRYQEASEFEKLAYWHIPVPGADDLLKIPKGTVGQLGGSIPVSLWRSFEKSRPEIALETMTDFVAGLIPNWIPSVMAPLLEFATGKKMYGQYRDVVPQWMQDAKPPGEQAQPWTAQWAKKLGAALNLSPLRLESLADTMTGGAIGRASDLAESASRLTKVMDDHPFQFSDLPIFSRFTSVAYRSSASAQRVYELSKDLGQRTKDLSSKERRDLSRLEAAKDQMSDLRARKRRGMLDPRIADEKIADVARRALEKIDQ